MSAFRRRFFALVAGLAALGCLLVALGTPASAQGATATLRKVIDTSAWSPPSPDPSGLAYLAATGRLFVSDGEVEETPIYRGADVFEMRKPGKLRRSFGVTRFTQEPAGIAVRPQDRSRLFLSDDDRDRVYILRWGRDRRWGTRDDRARSLSTRRFHSRDPEGLAFGRRSLFVAGGSQHKISRIHVGRNGVFDGVPPAGDDVLSSFGTKDLGLRDPEGVEYDAVTGHLFIVSRSYRSIAEVTLRGRLVNLIDISGTGILHPGGITILPRPADHNTARVYVADRGVDNATDPDENDGQIYVYEVTWPAAG